MEKPKSLCSYHGCAEPALKPAEDDSMEFCVAHDAELTKAANDARAMLSFWVKAQGGSTRAARLATLNVSHRTVLVGEGIYWQESNDATQ